MTMNNTTADALATTIVTNLGLTGDTATEALVHWKVVCRALYAAIVTDAVVSTTVAVTSVSGVTAGGASSGPGAGTGTGALS